MISQFIQNYRDRLKLYVEKMKKKRKFVINLFM